QIIAGLQTHRQPDQTIRDSCPRPILRRHAGMRRRDRSRDQCFDSAEARGGDRDACVRDESIRRFGTAFKLEAEHSAESIEQFAGAEMVGMALQAGIVDLRHARMLLEKARDAKRALILMTHAHGQRLESAMKQKTRVRIERTAEMIQLAGYVMNQ